MCHYTLHTFQESTRRHHVPRFPLPCCRMAPNLEPRLRAQQQQVWTYEAVCERIRGRVNVRARTNVNFENRGVKSDESSVAEIP
jgi:hypothetical protein